MYKIYRKMWLHRRFYKRIIFAFIVIFFLLYISVLLFGDLKSPRIMHIADLKSCPACYGVSVCPELYSNQIVLESSHEWTLFNAKNLYHGTTKSGKKVILKKLAHKWELNNFDSKMCSLWNMENDCKPIDLLNKSDAEEKIVNIVKYNLSVPQTEARKGVIMCPFAYSIIDLLRPVLNNKLSHKSDLINVWTMLYINPEPIILQIIPRSHGWPVPAFGGVCGRIEVVGNEGKPLSSLLHEPWHRKLKFALKILKSAMDFTFKHDRFRFYLMDWSLDNIVVNEKDEVTFVDLEDVVIIDKHISPGKDLPTWYERYTRENIGPGFSFSIDNMCRHHLSDHNLWAACYVLAGDEMPLLSPIPKEVNASRPHFSKLLTECVSGDSRFQTITKLQQVIGDMLADGKVSHIVS